RARVISSPSSSLYRYSYAPYNKGANMATTFILKNPAKGTIETLKRRYRDVDTSATLAYRKLLHLATDILTAADQRMSRHGLSQGRGCALIQLSGVEGGSMAPSELADCMGVARAT